MQDPQILYFWLNLHDWRMFLMESKSSALGKNLRRIFGNQEEDIAWGVTCWRPPDFRFRRTSYGIVRSCTISTCTVRRVSPKKILPHKLAQVAASLGPSPPRCWGRWRIQKTGRKKNPWESNYGSQRIKESGSAGAPEVAATHWSLLSVAKNLR